MLFAAPGTASARPTDQRVQASGAFIGGFAVPFFQEDGTQIQLVARSGPGGVDPGGHFNAWQASTGYWAEAEVTCLSVVGNDARVGLVVTDTNNPGIPENMFFYYFLRAKRGGHAAANSIDASGPVSTSASFCPAPTIITFGFDGPIHVTG